LKNHKNSREISDLQDQIQQMEREVRLRKEEINILRSVFLKHIPHEIRTPMNSIVGFSTLLAKSRLSDEERMEYLHHINASSEELLMVLDNLIDMALLHSGQISLEPGEFLLEKLFAELHQKFDDYRIGMGNGRIVMHHEIAEPLRSKFVKTDRHRLKQVLVHLIQNAFKFTQKGTINFRCYPDDADRVGFTVSDTGKGITTSDTLHIFDSFRKQEGPPSEKNRGLGLGLSISRELVEMLGGQLIYEPNKPHGSIFRFSLPLVILEGKIGIQLDRTQTKITRHVTKSGNGLAI